MVKTRFILWVSFFFFVCCFLLVYGQSTTWLKVRYNSEETNGAFEGASLLLNNRIKYIENRPLEDNQDEDENKPVSTLPFDIHWILDPPLRNGSDFAVTTDYWENKKYYLDREYEFVNTNPVLKGGVLLQTYNGMKYESLVAEADRDSWNCTITVDTPLVVYLLWDHRSKPYLPGWLNFNKWSLTDEIQEVTDYTMGYFDIFRGYFQKNEPIVLGHHQTSDVPQEYWPGSFWIVFFIPLEHEEFPYSYLLFQNYPNPFIYSIHSQTTITYSILDGGFIQLEIFNIRGQRVRGLINQYRRAGFHQEEWDGMDDNGLPLPSGTYICQLRAGNELPRLIKMVLVQ